MNDRSKTIDVNLSSLMSLKAELLRKQQEVKLAKSGQTAFAGKPAKQRNSLEIKGKTPKATNKKGEPKTYELDDTLELEKSRRVLEAKSKYYERMSRSGGSLNSDDNCLVMFNRKKQEADLDATETPIEDLTESRKKLAAGRYGSDSDDEDDWAEYVDCLGRTRKCLRKDLEEAKRRDRELERSMPERLDPTKANWMMDVTANSTQKTANSDDDDDEDEPPIGPRPPGSVFSECLSTVSKLEEQRANWEIKEQENLNKDDVHYQDVFFDEARQHGVGYYAFSTDEQERRKQQRDLERAREATLEEQSKREAARMQRERVIADRVYAARNRVRAREGLPPMTREEFELERNKKTAVQMEADRVQQEEQARLQQIKAEKAELDELREQQRQGYVRPWDKPKLPASEVKSAENTDNDDNDEGDEVWKYKPEREPMSQAEWNEKQRALRLPEFAPIPEPVPAPPRRTYYNAVPPPAPVFVPAKFELYQSSQNVRKFQRRNTSANDNCSDQDDAEPVQQRGCAVPPPTCLDEAMMPPPMKKRKSQADLERSIEAGLRFLRDNSDKANLAPKSSWSAKADY